MQMIKANNRDAPTVIAVRMGNDIFSKVFFGMAILRFLINVYAFAEIIIPVAKRSFIW